MVEAETIYRKRRIGGINFTPVMNLWLQRRQNRSIIIRRLKGKIIEEQLFLK